MHPSFKQAVAVIGLVVCLIPTFAVAAETSTSLPSTPGVPTVDQASPPIDQPVTAPSEEQAAPDNSRQAPDLVAEVRKPRAKMTCLADPLGAPNVVWLANLGDLPIAKGTKVELVIQPGNKTVIFVVPYDLLPGGWVELPKGTHPATKDMSCEVTKFIRTH